MTKVKRILWGVILIAAGLLLGLNALGITNLDLFFDGWWTLFIIVPCAMGLLTDRDKTGSLIGLLVGVFLLLCCQDILRFDMLWKLLIPIIIVLLGLKMVFGALLDGKSSQVMKRLKESGAHVSSRTAVFSGDNMDFSGEVFQGVELTAIFGGLECDLRNAIVQSDCVIEANSVFGGIDIYVPRNINVKVTSNAIFGGVSNKTAYNQQPGCPTLYVRANCLFGGVDIK